MNPIITKLAEKLFEGRKGHGGVAPITRRVLYREDLEAILEAAFELGRESESKPEEWIDFHYHKPFVELEFKSGVVMPAKVADFYNHLSRDYPASRITRFRPIRK